MSTPSADTVTTEVSCPHAGLRYRRPRIDDGAAMWRLARDTGVLDLNSAYAYLLWCRDFADTSIVVEVDGELVGFITGYIRPSAPHTLMVWQVATDSRVRGQGIATAMLTRLCDRARATHGVTWLETTITDDNAASIALFTRFAARNGAPWKRRPLFEADIFPGESAEQPGDEHDAEYLYLIGPYT